MKTGKILLIGLAASAAAFGIYKATRPKSGDEKREDLKKIMTDVTGEGSAAKVDEMSTEEVDTLHDTFSPTGGGGGGSSDSVWDSRSQLPAASKPVQSIRLIPAAMITTPKSKNPTVVISTKPTTSQPVIKYAAKPKTALNPRGKGKSAFTLVKKGMGSVDGTPAVKILRKYGIV